MSSNLKALPSNLKDKIISFTDDYQILSWKYAIACNRMKSCEIIIRNDNLKVFRTKFCENVNKCKQKDIVQFLHTILEYDAIKFFKYLKNLLNLKEINTNERKELMKTACLYKSVKCFPYLLKICNDILEQDNDFRRQCCTDIACSTECFKMMTKYMKQNDVNQYTVKGLLYNNDIEAFIAGLPYCEIVEDNQRGRHYFLDNYILKTAAKYGRRDVIDYMLSNRITSFHDVNISDVCGAAVVEGNTGTAICSLGRYLWEYFKEMAAGIGMLGIGYYAIRWVFG